MLGDVSDAGRKSSNEQWEEVVTRFQTLVRPFAGVPLQVVVGNHDVGDHHNINFAKRLPRFAASFHLDSTGSSQSHWKGVDFISLNAMAMRADGCSVCSSVEEIVNRTSSVLYGRHGEVNTSGYSLTTLDCTLDKCYSSCSQVYCTLCMFPSLTYA